MSTIPRFWLKAALVGLLALGVAWAVLGGQARAQSAPPVIPAGDMDISGVPLRSTHFALYWNVGAAGGGTANSIHFRLSGTLGQPTTGAQFSIHYQTCAGFSCGANKLIRKLFLPFTTTIGY